MQNRRVRRAQIIPLCWIGAVSFMLLHAAAPIAAQTCPGDCDGNGAASIAELQTGLAIALGDAPAPACAAVDRDGNGLVGAPELTRAVFAHLNGCAAAPPARAPRGAGDVVVHIGSATGMAGQTVSIGVTLETGGEEVAGVENVINFTATAPIAARLNGRPDCAVNPDIDKSATAFAFQPPGCDVGVSCTAIKAIVLAIDNVDPIPDGSLMYTCNVAISPSAADGVYPLQGAFPGAATPDGQSLPATITDGSITVGVAANTPTFTPVGGEAPASLILRRVKLRADVGIRLGRGLGSASVDAAVDTNLPFGALLDDIQAGGLMIALSTSGASIDLSWSAADCSVRPTSRGPRIRCAADDMNGQRRVSFRPTRTANVLSMELVARRITLRPPLATDPVHMTLTTAAFRRPDDIGGCEVKGADNDRKTCQEVGVIATPTPTVSATGTATSTATATSTVTLTKTITPTRSPIPTRTAVGTAADTPTPTPVVVPSVPLGERVFSVEPGVALAMPSGTRTGLFSSILGGGNGATSFSSGPLTLVGGLPDASGVAPLSLKEDVTLTVLLADGSYLCIKYVASGSTGSIDCDGGTAYDTEASQPAGDVGLPFTLQTGLGSPAAPGNGNLLVLQQSQQVPAGPTPDCATITYDDPGQTFGYTTTTATAIKGSTQLSVSGEPFSCNDFATPGSGGMLAAPAPTHTTDFGDSANVFRLGEGFTERVFTIGSNMAFGVGGGCNNCDNQTAGCQSCMNDSDCPIGQTCAPGMDLSRTGVFNGSPLGNTNAVDVISPGPLTLVLGMQDGTGLAPLRLKTDVILSGDVFGGAGCFCLKLLAAGSTGSLDCDGGTAYDTQIFQPAGQPVGWDVTTGLGAAAGPGNGNLLVMGQIAFTPAQSCSIVDCPNFTFADPPVLFPFTTTNAIALKGSSLMLTNHGEAFDCANFATPHSGGALVVGTAITLAPVGDTADSIRFSE